LAAVCTTPDCNTQFILDACAEDARRGFTSNELHLCSTYQMWYDHIIDTFVKEDERHILKNAWHGGLAEKSMELFRDCRNCKGSQERYYKSLIFAREGASYTTCLDQHVKNMIDKTMAAKDQNFNLFKANSVCLQAYRHAGRAVYGKSSSRIEVMPCSEGVPYDSIIRVMARAAAYIEIASYRFLQNVFSITYANAKTVSNAWEDLSINLRNEGSLFQRNEARHNSKTASLREHDSKIQEALVATDEWETFAQKRNAASLRTRLRNKKQ